MKKYLYVCIDSYRDDFRKMGDEVLVRVYEDNKTTRDLWSQMGEVSFTLNDELEKELEKFLVKELTDILPTFKGACRYIEELEKKFKMTDVNEFAEFS